MATSRTIGRQSSVIASLSPRWRHAAGIVGTIAANIGAFMVLFQLYKMVRKTFIVRGETIGFNNAEQIIDFERRLHLFFEPRLQHWIMQHEWLIRGLNWYYAGFMWTFYGCCVLAMILAPARYPRLRRVFLLSMLLALPWYAIYPLAPPRFMPQYGLFDTLAIYGPNYFKESGGLVAANHFAAMPSMHIGWTTIGGFMLAAAIPYRRIGAILGLTHVSLMTLTVMATGNHYVADVIGGWIIVAAAFALAYLLPDPLPLPWRRTRRASGGSELEAAWDPPSKPARG
jgi:membrane-associated phospholipid phosphatase